MKRVFMVAIAMMAMCVGVCSCGGDDESIEDAIKRDNRNIAAYWGESHCWMYGIWVEEQDKDNPNAGYTEITATGWTSVNALESNRVCRGVLSTRIGNINSIGFSKNTGSVYWFRMKWADASKERLEVYYEDAKGKPVAESKMFWVKLEQKPAGWQ